jgi:subtilase family serine protease
MKNILIILFVLLLFIFIPAVQASYSYYGIPFTIASQGTVNGGVYIDGGHGLEFPPYSQEFDVPDGHIRWARLYVGIWGGKEEYEGWVQVDMNGKSMDKVPLLGINDDSTNVYCSGHGVYWVYYDVTDIVVNGENAVIIETSQGEPGNKLDGRVYGTVLAAVYEDKNAPGITYEIYDGNVNLHSGGWSGKQENVNYETSVFFNDMQDQNSPTEAELTVVYLTSSKGLPDYLQFNGNQLGTTPQYLLDMGYQTGVTDIANEVSGDACSGSGIRTSYFDIEYFDVLEYAQTDNVLTFLLGRDLDGDGKIGDNEGEDYLHPVITSLVLKHRTATNPGPDLSIEVEIDENSLIEENDVEIPVVIGNPGGLYEGSVNIRLNVDGSEASTTDVNMDASGVIRSTINWHAAAGPHHLEVIVDPENVVQESNENNNVYEAEVDVNTRPDLSISIGEPKKTENQNSLAKASTPLLMLLVIGSLRRKKAFLMTVLLVAACFSGCTGPGTEYQQTDYQVPIVIVNNGESPARQFDVNLYLDEEKIAALHIQELDGSSSMEEEMMVTVEGGEYTLKAIVDEKNYVIESDEDNNVDEIVYNFT